MVVVRVRISERFDDSWLYYNAHGEELAHSRKERPHADMQVRRIHWGSSQAQKSFFSYYVSSLSETGLSTTVGGGACSRMHHIILSFWLPSSPGQQTFYSNGFREMVRFVWEDKTLTCLSPGHRKATHDPAKTTFTLSTVAATDSVGLCCTTLHARSKCTYSEASRTALSWRG